MPQWMIHPIYMWAEPTGLRRLFKKKRTGSWEEGGLGVDLEGVIRKSWKWMQPKYIVHTYKILK